MTETRVFIITGSRKGLGFELSKHFLELGHIVVGCSRGKSTIQHESYKHFEMDVSDEKEVINIVRSVKSEFGQINVLINNAGTAAMNHLLTTPYKSARQIFNTNFFGTFLFTREVAKLMMKEKKGSIVNFTTVAVPLNLAGEAIYAASKSSVETLTRISAKELGEFGIRVNAIGPTPIQTDLIKNVPKEKIDNLIAQQSINRFGNWQDVLNTINYFIDDKSEFITGQIIYLGGIFE
jgi:3-oxoacyl-[acyl-carrier protein] reductase